MRLTRQFLVMVGLCCCVGTATATVSEQAYDTRAGRFFSSFLTLDKQNTASGKAHFLQWKENEDIHHKMDSIFSSPHALEVYSIWHAINHHGDVLKSAKETSRQQLGKQLLQVLQTDKNTVCRDYQQERPLMGMPEIADDRCLSRLENMNQKVAQRITSAGY